MKFIKILFVFFFLFTATKGFGQYNERIIKLSYGAGFPIGDLGKFIENKLFDGIGIEGRYFLTDKVSLGISTGWNTFSKSYERAVYKYEDGEISAVQTRFFRSIPILLTGHYYLGNYESKFKPYAGIGVGAYQLHYEKWYGTFAEGKDSWSFGVRPEIGIMVPLTEKVGIDFNVRYNYAVYSYNDVEDFFYPEATLGVFLYLD